MLDIQWRSAFGYGDFVTGLGYAHGASIKYETDVQLTFHWDQDLDHKEHPGETETIVERMYYVYNTMTPLENVIVKHNTNSKLDYRFINNLDEFNPLHGLWYSSLLNTTNNTVVLWRSKYNTFFPGMQKDPACNDWDYIIKKLIDSGYDVREVTYRTPINEVMELIRTCKFGIGYDGLIHQLYKFMWKPLIVVCQRHSLNRLLIPQAALVSNCEQLFEKGVTNLVNESMNRCAIIREQHKNWMSDKQVAFKHDLFNKKIGK